MPRVNLAQGAKATAPLSKESPHAEFPQQFVTHSMPRKEDEMRMRLIRKTQGEEDYQSSRDFRLSDSSA